MATIKYLDPETGEYKSIGMSGGGTSIPASDTEPATGNYWLDTSAEGGTYYTAGQTLSNETRELLGLGSNATPDEAFAEIIRQLSYMPAASIFVTGLSEADTVTATKGSKTVVGKWVQKETFTPTQVPVMTSNTTPSGVASCKSSSDGNAAYHAFMGSPSSNKQAHSSGDSKGWWLSYDFGYPVKIESFEICPQYNTHTFWDRIAKTLILQGSNDGDTWIDIQTFVRTTDLSEVTYDNHKILEFTVDNPVIFQMFRLVWVDTTSGVSSCSYLQFYGSKVEIVNAFEISPIREFGTWTVTATDGTETYTQDVLVDVITNYKIEMLKKLYLYRDGDECEDVTGGWDISGWVYTGGSFTPKSFTKEDSYIHMYNSSSSEDVPSIATQSKIAVSGYSKMCFEVTATSVYGSGSRINFSTIKDMNSNASGVDVKLNFSNVGNNIYTIDLDSSISDVYVSIYNWTGYYTVGDITKIWLE